MNTIRKRLSGVKGGRFAQRCAPAQVFSIVLSDILGDPLDMIASGPAVPDTSTCAQALAVAEKYHLALSAQARALLAQETPKMLDNVTTRITGSVRELCRAAASACRNLGYEPVLLTDQLCCEAREAGSFLGSIVRTQAGQGKKLAYIAGGETIVHLTGKGLGGRNQELALAAAPAIAGLNAAVFSAGSDGTDGPTDAAGGYVDGDTLAALEAGGWSGYAALQNNDSYHALKAVDGLIITGAPVEQMEYEEVQYWEELKQIMEWSKANVTSTKHICWGAQAGLYYHYGIKKHLLPKKIVGVYEHRVHHRKAPLLRGFDDVFYAPHSRYTGVDHEAIAACDTLTVLADSDKVGELLLVSDDGKQIFVMGHLEYDRLTLDYEYKRDSKKGLNPDLPENYYPDDDSSQRPLLRWRGASNALFSNWVNYYVYQNTPYEWS